MNFALRSTKTLLWAVCLLGVILGFNPAFAADPKEKETKGKKLEIILVWGTDLAESPDAKHKPLSPELVKKLQLFKWKNYFLVNKVTETVAPKGSTKKKLSDKCEVELRDIGDSNFEIDLLGEGKHVVKKTQKITKGETLAFGGNVKQSDGSWFVLIREVE